MSKKYAGLVKTNWPIHTNVSSGGGELTLDMLDKAVKYFQSDEYHEAQRLAAQREADSRNYVTMAFEQGIITEIEALQLHANITRDGYLLVGSDMAKRLEKVRI